MIQPCLHVFPRDKCKLTMPVAVFVWQARCWER